MHVNAIAWDLKTRRKNEVEKYILVFRALCPKSKMKRRGRNKENDHLTGVMDLSVK